MDFTIARKNNSGAINWSEDQKHYIVSQYVDNNCTLKELAKQFQVQTQSIRNLLRKENIEIVDKKTKDYPRNSDFFENINNNQKAYWLGMFFSDGCVSSTRDEISLSLKDKEHVFKFKKAIEANNTKILERIDTRFSKPCYTYKFQIRDKKLKQDLIKWGCLPQKSSFNFHYPNIPQEFDWDFIRGYFDGDGSIYFTDNKYRLSYVGNKMFLEDLKIKLHKENLSLCQNSVSKITYDLKICGNQDVERILKLMYANSNDETRLNRKYETYLKYLNFLQAHHT